MKLQLVTYPNKLLTKKCDPIVEVSKKHIELAGSMHYHMGLWNGVGLSAPQVGRLIQLITVNDGTTKRTIFNPKILLTKDTQVMNEGCLSFKNIYKEIERPKFIILEYMDINNNIIIEEFDGLMSRIILHEYDHLLGITFDKY